MVARSTCLSPFCGARVLERRQGCPRCGRRMFDDGDIGRRGWHVLQLGLILAAVAGAILWFWSPGMMRTIAGAPPTSFTGTAGQAWLMLLGLGTLGLTGLAFMLSAAMMISGRSSRATTLAAILLFLATIGLLAAAFAGQAIPG